MNRLHAPRLPIAAALSSLFSVAPAALLAQDGEAPQMEEIVVTGSLRSLPGEDVEVFGFGKSLLETPRSA